jgi:flagellar biosynthetic protein FliQ
MSESAVIDLLREAFFVALRLAGPLLLVSLSVGLMISLFQAATQIQEQTLTFVPKLVIVGVALILLAPCMIRTMREFMEAHFDNAILFMR